VFVLLVVWRDRSLSLEFVGVSIVARSTRTCSGGGDHHQVNVQ
jgi:hypothetical protein